CLLASRHHLSYSFYPPATTELYPLSLHDALPISTGPRGTVSTWSRRACVAPPFVRSPFLSPSSDAPSSSSLSEALNFTTGQIVRSEEHTSELQSRFDLVCRLLLEKKKNQKTIHAR